jgi:guanylate kinase
MLISLTGPSGIGKGFIKKALFEYNPDITELPWLTTRPNNREKETNRIFVSPQQFQNMVNKEALILTQTLFGYQYGLQKHLLKTNTDQILLTELHIENIVKLNSLRIKPKAIGLIPSSIEFLRRRLELYRATEKQKEIELRLKKAEKEIQQILDNKKLFLKIIDNISEITEKNVTPLILETLKTYLI